MYVCIDIFLHQNVFSDSKCIASHKDFQHIVLNCSLFLLLLIPTTSRKVGQAGGGTKYK